MTLPVLRPSGLGRNMKCFGSSVLPHVGSESDATIAGNRRHKYLAEHPEIGLKLLGASGAQISNVQTEKKMSYKGMTGTADFVGYSGVIPVILDYKGRGEVDSPSQNNQLKAYALMEMQGPGMCMLAIANMTDEYECVNFESALVSHQQMMEFESELNVLKDRRNDYVTNGGTPELFIGAHCRYCPAISNCPAQTNLLKDVAMIPRDVAMTQQIAIQAWERKKALENVIEIVDAAIRNYASTSPFNIPGGKRVGPVEVAKDEIDPELALSVMPELGRLRENKLSKSAIEKAFGKEAIFRLRIAGAIKTILTEQVREYKI